MDISGLIKSTSVQLEAEAFKQFGAAVQNQASGILDGVLKRQKPGLGDAGNITKNVQNGIWDPTWYAARLAAGHGGYQPKNKFLFKVKFDFFEEVRQAAASMGVDINDLPSNLTVIVKSIDLPKITFEYEDINYYNFRSKCLKKIFYEDLNMEFYDDVSNHAISFIDVYMKLLKPITRTVPTTAANLENFGFAFNKNYIGADSSYRGVLPGNRRDIISKMTIEQFYLNTGEGPPIDAIKVNSFVFTNPKIMKFDVSDQDHETGNSPNFISMSLSFDALNIEKGTDGKNHVTPSAPNGSDILDGTEEIAASLSSGSQAQIGKASNPFVNIIARQGQRMVQTGIAAALGNKVGTIAGGALQGAIGEVSGALGAATQKTLQSVSQGISQSIVLPKLPFIKDSSASTSASSRQSSTDK